MMSATILLLLLAMQAIPVAPPVVRMLPISKTISGGEPAWMAWTPTNEAGVVYQFSLDNGAWQAIPPGDIETAKDGTGYYSMGKLPLGLHDVALQACLGTRCSAAIDTGPFLVNPPEACVPGAWGEWDPWSDWIRLQWDPATERRWRTHYRAILVQGAPGSDPCHSVETESEDRPYVPPALDPVTAAFVGTDVTTLGDWRGVYGSQGAAFAAAGDVAMTAGAVTQGFGTQTFTWQSNTTDKRALLHPTAADGARIVSTWYAPVELVVDVKLADTAPHRVTFYLLDWDRMGRRQTVEVLDNHDGVVLPALAPFDMSGGVYVTWRVTGHARFRFRSTGATNAVAAAVFLDAVK